MVGRGHNESLQLLIRLQHLFSVGDDPELSKPVTLDLVAWLSAWGDVLHLDETTLTAAKVIKAQAVKPLTLSPMEIRTFLVTLQPR